MPKYLSCGQLAWLMCVACKAHIHGRCRNLGESGSYTCKKYVSKKKGELFAAGIIRSF